MNFDVISNLILRISETASKEMAVEHSIEASSNLLVSANLPLFHHAMPTFVSPSQPLMLFELLEQQVKHIVALLGGYQDKRLELWHRKLIRGNQVVMVWLRVMSEFMPIFHACFYFYNLRIDAATDALIRATAAGASKSLVVCPELVGSIIGHEFTFAFNALSRGLRDVCDAIVRSKKVIVLLREQILDNFNALLPFLDTIATYDAAVANLFNFYPNYRKLDHALLLKLIQTFYDGASHNAEEENGSMCAQRGGVGEMLHVMVEGVEGCTYLRSPFATTSNSRILEPPLISHLHTATTTLELLHPTSHLHDLSTAVAEALSLQFMVTDSNRGGEGDGSEENTWHPFAYDLDTATAKRLSMPLLVHSLVHTCAIISRALTNLGFARPLQSLLNKLTGWQKTSVQSTLATRAWVNYYVDVLELILSLNAPTIELISFVWSRTVQFLQPDIASNRVLLRVCDLKMQLGWRQFSLPSTSTTLTTIHPSWNPMLQKWSHLVRLGFGCALFGGESGVAFVEGLCWMCGVGMQLIHVNYSHQPLSRLLERVSACFHAGDAIVLYGWESMPQDRRWKLVDLIQRYLTSITLARESHASTFTLDDLVFPLPQFNAVFALLSSPLRCIKFRTCFRHVNASRMLRAMVMGREPFTLFTQFSDVFSIHFQDISFLSLILLKIHWNCYI